MNVRLAGMSVLCAAALVLSGCGSTSEGSTTPASTPAGEAGSAASQDSSSEASSSEGAASSSALVALTPDQLSAGQVSQQQLDFMNGGTFTQYATGTGSDVLSPEDPAFGDVVADPTEVSPAVCADAVLAIGVWQPDNWAAAAPTGFAQSRNVSDVTQTGADDLLVWFSTSVLTTPEKAKELVSAAAAGLPDCQGATMGTGETASTVNRDITMAGDAVITVDRDTANIHVIEPIGAVIYSVGMGALDDPKSSVVTRWSATYNELADALAAEQGLTRSPIDLNDAYGTTDAGIAAESTPTSPSCLASEAFDVKLLKNYSSYSGPGQGEDVFAQSRERFTNNCGKPIKAFEYGTMWEDEFGDLLLNCTQKARARIKPGGTHTTPPNRGCTVGSYDEDFQSFNDGRVRDFNISVEVDRIVFADGTTLEN